VTVEAIVNPDNGPGAAQDGTFVSGLGKLTGVGIVPFGYVATNYGKKTSAAVKLEIDAYRRMYPAVTGIFFDEMSDVAADGAYYRALTAYAKQNGFSRTVGNPGTDVPESLIGTVDTLFIYESAGTPALAPLAGWHASYPAKNFGIIPYKVPTLDPTFVQRARTTIGFIYVTNDDLPDPWDISGRARWHRSPRRLPLSGRARWHRSPRRLPLSGRARSGPPRGDAQCGSARGHRRCRR
jgi:hypothetical protein